MQNLHWFYSIQFFQMYWHWLCIYNKCSTRLTLDFKDSLRKRRLRKVMSKSCLSPARIFLILDFKKHLRIFHRVFSVTRVNQLQWASILKMMKLLICGRRLGRLSLSTPSQPSWLTQVKIKKFRVRISKLKIVLLRWMDFRLWRRVKCLYQYDLETWARPGSQVLAAELCILFTVVIKQ